MKTNISYILQQPLHFIIPPLAIIIIMHFMDITMGFFYYSFMNKFLGVSTTIKKSPFGSLLNVSNQLQGIGI